MVEKSLPAVLPFILPRKPKTLLFLVVLAYSSSILDSTLPHGGMEVLEIPGKELWVEVHDVSPAYLEELEEVMEVLQRHPKAYSKVVLFVIPNHGGAMPMHEYPEFVAKLKELQGRGFILGLHGYTHDNPLVSPEFKTSRLEAEKLLLAAEREFNASGLKFPSYFLPPGWRAAEEVRGLLREKFQFIYYYSSIESSRGIIPSKSREYVWNRHVYKALERARRDYANSRGVVRLSLHLRAINTQEGLRFLQEYLSWIEDESKSI